MESTRHSPASEASFRMIDIGEKPDTHRKALASGSFFAPEPILARIRNRDLPKGDVLALSEVAGIQGAKRTSDLLPLCHPLPLTSVRVWHEFREDSIRVFCEAKTVGKTGVEMEALSGVSAALLCLYDLTKGVERNLKLGDILLDLKEGGKSDFEKSQTQLWRNLRVSILIMSDRCFNGLAEDRSGPLAVSVVQSLGASIEQKKILPDNPNDLKQELNQFLDLKKSDLLIVSGGTGVGPRDISPDVVEVWSQAHRGKIIPGIGEILRKEGASQTRLSWLSRSLGVIVGDQMVVCLPGSPNAVEQGIRSIAHLIPHLIQMARGGNHEKHV